jgi:uncharacterized membrane protein YbhN (UPF0104 family)
MADDAPAPRRRLVERALVFAAVVVLCVVLGRRLDPDRVLLALSHADWRLVALAALINITLNTAARVGRWSALLGALPREGAAPGFVELGVLYLASQAASNLLPARAGEALRVVQLHRKHGYPVSELITVQLVETIVAAVTLGSLALLVAPLPLTPGALSAALFTFAFVGLGGGLAVFALARRAPAPAPAEGAPARTGLAGLLDKARALLRRLVAAVHHLRSPRVWARSLAWSLLSDLTDVLMIGLVLHAVGVSLSPLQWIVAFVAINLVLLLPTTPAQLGVLEIGAVAALRALGVDEHPALAFALLYHASHVIPPTLLGGALLLKIDLRRAAPIAPPR